jgi:hypothetical protein
MSYVDSSGFCLVSKWGEAIRGWNVEAVTTQTNEAMSHYYVTVFWQLLLCPVSHRGEVGNLFQGFQLNMNFYERCRE